MFLEIKTFSFQDSFSRYEYNLRDKIVNLKKIYRTYAGYKKMLRNKIVCFKEISKFSLDYYSSKKFL